MHAHSHAHGSSQSDIGKLRLALIVTGGILLIEGAGGFFAHSLALLTDAAHMLTDVGAAGLGLWAAILAQRSPDPEKTFGYGRATVLAALTNAAALFAIVVFIVIEAFGRLHNPQAVNSGLMIGVALFALIANLLLSSILARGDSESINVKGVNAHVLGDAAISAGVVIAAIIIYFTRFPAVDAIASILASAAVAFSAWSLIRETLNILMEGVPEGLNVAEVATSIRDLEPIQDVHDLHVWSLSDRRVAASLHVQIRDRRLDESPSIVNNVKRVLHDKFHIDHATVEIECENCEAAC